MQGWGRGKADRPNAGLAKAGMRDRGDGTNKPGNPAGELEVVAWRDNAGVKVGREVVATGCHHPDGRWMGRMGAISAALSRDAATTQGDGFPG